MNKIQELKSYIEKKIGQKEQIESQISDCINRIKVEESELEIIRKAKAIIQKVAKDTQDNFSIKIDKIVCLALDSVFSDYPFDFKSRFEIKRGKTECNLLLVSGDKEIVPRTGSGGICDVIAFALRMSVYSLNKNKLRNVLIFDEPIKNINDKTRETHKKIAEMIKITSEIIGCQKIIVTLIPEILDVADNVIFTKLKHGNTVVEYQ